MHAVSSLVIKALIHLLKIKAWPDAVDSEHWQEEFTRFHGDAADRFTPSMRRRIDIAKLYEKAPRRMPKSYYGIAPAPLPRSCPVTLEELLAQED